MGGFAVQGRLEEAAEEPNADRSLAASNSAGVDRLENSIRIRRSGSRRSGSPAQKHVAVVLAVVMIISALGVFVVQRAPNEPMKVRTSGTPHANILIDGNSNFTSSNGVVSGSGTATDPYIIEGLDIDSSLGIGIDVRNTDAYFVIRDVNINSTTAGYSGIHFDCVANGRIEQARFAGNRQSVLIEHSENSVVNGCNVSSSGDAGIRTSFCGNTSLTNNRVSPFGYSNGMSIENCVNSTIIGNDLGGVYGGIWLYSSANTTVAGNDLSHAYIGASCGSCRNATVLDNNFSWCWGSAISLSSCGGFNITGNNASNCAGGISCSYSSDLIVASNDVSSSGSGIYLSYSDGALVVDNDMREDAAGVGLSYSKDVKVNRNVFTSGGIYLEGDSVDYYATHTITTDNLIGGKPIYYYKDGTDLAFHQDVVGELIVANYTNVQVANLAIDGTQIGIEMAFVSDCIMKNVTIAHEHNHALLLCYCEDVNITDSDISYNTNYYDNPIFLDHCSRIDVTECSARGNVGNTLVSAHSANVRVLSSNFSDNTNGAISMDSATNITIVGNHINNGGGGIALANSANILIADNTARNAGSFSLSWCTNATIARNDLAQMSISISIYGCSVVDILQNSVSSAWQVGISVAYFCSKVNVVGNNASDEPTGINFYWASSCTIANNVLLNDQHGLTLEGTVGMTIVNNTFESDGISISGLAYMGYGSVEEFNTHTIATSNLVNGKPVYYFRNESHVDVTGIPVGQLIVANCTHVLAADLSVGDTDVAVEMAYASDVSIENVTGTRVRQGMMFYDCADVAIRGANVSWTDMYGVLANYCENFTLDNSSLAHGSNYNIIVSGGSNLTISRNTITNNGGSSRSAVQISTVAGWTNIIGNTISDCSNILIEAVSCANVTVSMNNASGSSNGDGICTNGCTNVLISGNIAVRNRAANIHVSNCQHAVVSGNNASGTSISNYGIVVDWTGFDVKVTKNVAMDLQITGVVFSGITISNITNNVVSSKGDAIQVISCTGFNVRANIVTAPNGNGIFASSCNGFNIVRNNVSSCCYRGIYVTSSVNGAIKANDLWNNTCAIYIASSTSIRVFHNNLLGNVLRGYDDSGSQNQWDDDYPNGGNYWSNYSGSDAFSGPGQDISGSDGIGDTTMVIDSDSVDRYPLMAPWPVATGPVTTHDYTDYWHTSNFTIILTAAAPESQVLDTYYIINGGPMKTVKLDGLPVITTEGSNNTLEFWSEDIDGIVEDHSLLTGIKLDRTPPTGSIVVNSGAEYTNSSSVTLDLKASDAVSGMGQMRLNDGSSGWSTWENFSATKAWTLTGGGLKVVQVQFSDVAGNTAIYSDSIMLDRVAPTASIVINSGAAYTNTTSVALSLTASDATSDVDKVRYSNDGVSWSSWEPAVSSKPWILLSGNGMKTVYYQVVDRAGNSVIVTDTILLDTASATFYLNLSEGWNLVAVPVVASGHRASTLGLDTGDVVCGWNSATGAYRMYIVGISPSVMDFSIVPSTGYWIYVQSGTETLTLEGVLPSTPQTRTVAVPAGGGWALIGFNSLDTAKHASDIPAMYSVAGGVKMVVSWDSATKAYRSWISTIPTMNNFLLVPGQGYWIYCSASGVLTYNP
ncbi:MAG: hypothetical protein C4K47_05325 [Candidatus Thorarchaeota archaeon]|nr:MAG: hypothetical protein C4K47_05325 [Candidatus Thorarchaeota archaeon]